MRPAGRSGARQNPWIYKRCSCEIPRNARSLLLAGRPARPAKTSVYELDADATLQELSEAIIKSGFLQFTSTHAVMVGEVGKEALVRVFGPHPRQHQSPQYLKAAAGLARNLIGAGELHFRFIFDFEG